MPCAYTPEEYQAIFERLLTHLRIALNMQAIPYDINGNRLRLFLNAVKANHYEVCFREKYLEIGLHFESTLQPNELRLNAFIDHKEKIITAMGMPVQFGKLEN